MKVIVAGSRTLNEAIHEKVIWELLNRLTTNRIEKIISGGADGPDSFGISWALEHDVELEIFKPDWKKHGKSAGYIRNEEMAKAGTMLIALWDGQSKGTKHMIDLALKHGCNVYVAQVPVVQR